MTAVLKGMIPAAAAVLLLGQLLAGGPAIGGAMLAFMGLILGALAGVLVGRWLARQSLAEADRYLFFLLGLIFLPLALLPARPEIFRVFSVGYHGWLAVALGAFAAAPAGFSLGCSWPLLLLESKLPRSARRVWIASGAVLGTMLAAGAAAVLSTFLGLFLVNLFAAPLVWPTLPKRGERSALVRMMLTLMVMLSCMFLIFV